MPRPSFTSRVKLSQRLTSSGSSRAIFSISEASMAAASSPSSRIAHGMGSASSPASRRSSATRLAAWKRRAPATISKPSGAQLGRTRIGTMTPRLRTVGRMSETSGAFFA
jgi:hypothetical protein